MLSGGSQFSTVMSCANTFQLLTLYLLSNRSLADRTQTLAAPDICRGWACHYWEESGVWLRSGCDVNQGRSCVASDFMRNASNGQCKTGAVEWQVAVTNRENRIPKNAIIELLFDVWRVLQNGVKLFSKLHAILSYQESLDVHLSCLFFEY